MKAKGKAIMYVLAAAMWAYAVGDAIATAIPVATSDTEEHLVDTEQPTIYQDAEEAKLLLHGPPTLDQMLDAVGPTILEGTGYTANKESTGKSPGHPAYGITRSGAKAERGVTVAMGRSIPEGTKVYIPYFEDLWGDGWFTVQDRGGAITDNHIDIFFGYDKRALTEALDFGRRDIEVYIMQ